MSSQDSKTTESFQSTKREHSYSASEEVECTSYSGIRIRGRGGSWDSFKPTILSKTKTQEIIDKNSLGTWQCGVCVTTDRKDGMPTNSSVPFLLLLERSRICSEFFVCGENSTDNVFHTHFLLKTTSRADSVRRSLLSHSHDSGYIFDVCKLAGCRFWFGMLAYMCKNPLAIYTTNVEIGNLAYTIIEDGTCIKYLEKSNKGIQGKEVVRIINSIIEQHDCTTIEEIYKAGQQQLIPFLHLSTLSAIMSNCLNLKTATDSEFNPKSFKYAPYASPEVIHKVLEKQNIDLEEFDTKFWKWICRENGKLNTFVFIGPSNTGKSTFIRGLINLVPSGMIVNTSSCFFSEGIAGKQLAVWEEPLLMQENAEAFKCIAEGLPTTIPQKFKKPYNHPGCPLIITTNHPIWRFCEQEKVPIMNRCVFWHFYTLISSFREPCSDDCIYYRRAQCFCATSRISWGSALRHSDGQPVISASRGSSGSFSSLSSQCGRWWCGSNNGRPCSYCFRSRFKRTKSRGSRGSSGTSISRSGGSSSEHETGSSGDGISSWVFIQEPLLRSSEQPSTSTQEFLGGIRQPTIGGGLDGLGSSGCRINVRGHRESNTKRSEISCGGGWSESTPGSWPECEVEARKICTCVIEPDKYDWQAYLCYLANKYGRP